MQKRIKTEAATHTAIKCESELNRSDIVRESASFAREADRTGDTTHVSENAINCTPEFVKERHGLCLNCQPNKRFAKILGKRSPKFNEVEQISRTLDDIKSNSEQSIVKTNLWDGVGTSIK